MIFQEILDDSLIIYCHFSQFFVNIHENHTKSVFFDFCLPRGIFFNLAGDGEGGGVPSWAHFRNTLYIYIFIYIH